MRCEVFIKKNIPLLFLILLAGLLLSFRIDKTFIGHHDWNGVVYGHLARSYLREGFFQKGATHYPPLLPICLSVSFAIFGVVEWAARLVPLMASLGMIVLLFKLTEELWNQQVAVFACLFLIFTPMFLYFGKMPVHETVSPVFVLFTLFHYYHWLKKGLKRSYFFIILGTILGGLTSWAGYYLVPLLIIHCWCFKKEKEFFRRIFLLFPLSIMMFISHLFYIKLSTGSFIDKGFLKAFLFRFNLGPQAETVSFTYSKFFILQARWMVVYFTRIVVVLSFLWMMLFLFSFLKNKKIGLKESFILILLFFGFTHSAIFRNAAFIHDYLLYYTLPFFSMAAGLVLYQFGLRIKNNFLKIIFYSLVFYLFITERIPFTKTLLATKMNESGYKLGVLIKQLTSKREEVLVASKEFGAFLDVFVRFYADREVKYQDFNLEDFKKEEKELKKKYRFFIITKTHDYVPYDLKDYLRKRYPSFAKEEFVFYDLERSEFN